MHLSPDHSRENLGTFRVNTGRMKHFFRELEQSEDILLPTNEKWDPNTSLDFENIQCSQILSKYGKGEERFTTVAELARSMATAITVLAKKFHASAKQQKAMHRRIDANIVEFIGHELLIRNGTRDMGRTIAALINIVASEARNGMAESEREEMSRNLSDAIVDIVGEYFAKHGTEYLKENDEKKRSVIVDTITNRIDDALQHLLGHVSISDSDTTEPSSGVPPQN